MKIPWANFRFWWTNELMIHYLSKGNFSKVEKLLLIRKKLAETLRLDIQNKIKIKDIKERERKEWLKKPKLSWKIVSIIF